MRAVLPWPSVRRVVVLMAWAQRTVPVSLPGVVVVPRDVTGGVRFVAQAAHQVPGFDAGRRWRRARPRRCPGRRTGLHRGAGGGTFVPREGAVAVSGKCRWPRRTPGWRSACSGFAGRRGRSPQVVVRGGIMDTPRPRYAIWWPRASYVKRVTKALRLGAAAADGAADAATQRAAS